MNKNRCDICGDTNNLVSRFEDTFCSACEEKYDFDLSDLRFAKRKKQLKETILVFGKEYKPFQKVFVLATIYGKLMWIPAIYCMKLKICDSIQHEVISTRNVGQSSYASEEIVPYEGNEHLINGD